ncbi:hypothetical protein ADILRU_0436 [Leifsonia rubra CMS 76R]|nr:hypothetical protein ADILRU_0436 [Leifsonia rubra CMS 76R]
MRSPGKRRHGEMGYYPPVEAEEHFYTELPALTEMERV